MINGVWPTRAPNSSTVAKPYIQNGRNPAQNPHVNLGGAAVTRCVGGMSSHWTCAIPEQHPKLERYPLYPDDETKDNTEWARLYKHSKYLINYSPDGEAFEKYSVRQRLVRHTLETAYPARKFPPLPQGVKRRSGNDRFVTWSSAATVLGDYWKDKRFKLLPNHLCRKLEFEAPDNTKVIGADVEDLGTRNPVLIKAKRAYVVCAGAVLTPQLLHNSGIRPAALVNNLSTVPD